MRTRSKLSILAFFSCCAVASMGFANWVITQSPQTATGSVKADNVILSNDYLSMAGNPSALQYTSAGFINGDEISFIGTVAVSYELDIENCITIFGENKVTAEISIGYNAAGVPDKNLFDASFNYVSATVENESFFTVSSNGLTGDSLKITLSIDLAQAKQAENSKFNIAYKISLSDSTYTDFFYKPFFGTGLAFEFNAQLKGVN